ncbi:FAD-dependent oxidoreductase [Verrucosispora sp. WMMC514]|uniref:FAD-dependent oxidoreductase n=1 Tax=Verrucosispora sp. WMMC514 TaxID=3015156 RepID=UPI00248D2C32|nr:FAD-dependent oxidoreductase [Verrucosispora sp. WMMC514]WBB94084.1 FAD-dependent monooxygenase [Verrucosispora sp. WMMC514]
MIVVGAGPTGLTAALALRAAGLPATVLEAEPADRARPGSRALFVHNRTLRLLAGLNPDLAEEIAQRAVVWPTRETYYRGRLVYSRSYPPHSGGLPPFASLRQVETERLLLAACERAGVQFEWGTGVTTVSTGPQAVTLETGDGRRWSSGYVVAADGARSAVRRSLGVRLHGPRPRGFHVVVDLAEDPNRPMPPRRIFRYEHPALDGRTVLQVPFAGGWQIDLQCRDTDAPETFDSVEAARRWLPAVVPKRYRDRILWVARYHFHQVVADRLTDEHHRVLLAGEAAHLFPPFGARGMNSGIADAVAAAEAIAAADADPTAVPRYAARRHAAARYNRDAAGAALRHLRPGRAMRIRQRCCATLAPVVPALGRWLETAPYGPRQGPSADSKY